MTTAEFKQQGYVTDPSDLFAMGMLADKTPEYQQAWRAEFMASRQEGRIFDGSKLPPINATIKVQLPDFELAAHPIPNMAEATRQINELAKQAQRVVQAHYDMHEMRIAKGQLVPQGRFDDPRHSVELATQHLIEAMTWLRRALFTAGTGDF